MILMHIIQVPPITSPPFMGNPECKSREVTCDVAGGLTTSTREKKSFSKDLLVFSAKWLFQVNFDKT